MYLSEKSIAPDFELADETGKFHKLSDYRGKYVLLYFYPKDDTPGCTTEACSFRDAFADYSKAGVVIFGLSGDSVKSHLKFKEKYHLPFNLLSDEEHKVLEAYGVWGLKKMMGREYMGIFRTSYLIAPDGTVKKVFENVKPDGHSQEVLAAL
ncbi:putative peroxiredoxin bcp [bioreactor metagenome]|jgi:thioredoxin-dependent peroxiredoxin|uniref:thioredoxin-dependent peroxiredoxin n=1 Tax=bioreactor metagenome TaxID=1076179 RepID=A0A645CGA2_9ZZZZ